MFALCFSCGIAKMQRADRKKVPLALGWDGLELSEALTRLDCVAVGTGPWVNSDPVCRGLCQCRRGVPEDRAKWFPIQRPG